MFLQGTIPIRYLEIQGESPGDPPIVVYYYYSLSKGTTSTVQAHYIATNQRIATNIEFEILSNAFGRIGSPMKVARVVRDISLFAYDMSKAVEMNDYKTFAANYTSKEFLEHPDI
jgi:hypothetical protein